MQMLNRMKLRAVLLCTSAVIQLPVGMPRIIAPLDASRRHKHKDKSSGHLQRPAPVEQTARSKEIARGITGIVLKNDLPIIDPSTIVPEEFNRLPDACITRHFPLKYLDATLSGSLRFGTTLGYRGSDTSQIGRFSDPQEATQWIALHAPNNVYDYLKVGEGTISNVGFSGFDTPVAVEFQINDFTSCSSRGEFSLPRAQKLRERGNEDINAFAVYDLAALVRAISDIISESDSYSDLMLIGRVVHYGAKDWHVLVNSFHKLDTGSAGVAIWAAGTFVKPIDYEHEDEVRLVLAKRRAIGRLDESIKSLTLFDRRIADAIVDSGQF